MAIYSYKGVKPEIGNDCYIADSAEVIGNVKLGNGCYVGPKAVVRADYGQIVIGDNCAIEELCMIHARPDEVTRIGNNVTLGHACVIHTPKEIGDFSVIGMNSVVSDFAILGEWAVVGEGAVVKNGGEVPLGKIAVGIPAKVIADVSDKYKETWTKYKAKYVELAKTYQNDLRKI